VVTLAAAFAARGGAIPNDRAMNDRAIDVVHASRVNRCQ
jgi:hypothetical protein